MPHAKIFQGHAYLNPLLLRVAAFRTHGGGLEHRHSQEWETVIGLGASAFFAPLARLRSTAWHGEFRKPGQNWSTGP